MGMLRKLCSALGTERLARAILGNTALTMYMSKWAGADTSGAFDNVQITVL